MLSGRTCTSCKGFPVMGKRKPNPEADRADAYICLFCTKEECTGADACFREQKKQRQRQYQADRRKAQQSLDAFYNAQQAKENRRRRMEAQAAFQKRKEAE